VHVDHVGLRIEVIIPDIFQKHGAGHHLSGMLHEIFQQPELARLQVEFLRAAVGNDPRVEVRQFEGLLVDFAKKIGATTYGTASPGKHEFLRERGLKLVSDLDANEYREKVMGTAGRHMQGYGFYHTVLAEVSDA